MSDVPDEGTPEVEIPAGAGTQLATWAIAAMAGEPASTDDLDDADAKRLRRVNDAIAALTDARPGPTGAGS